MSAIKAGLVGINHVALEVGDIAAALDFYGRYFTFELRGRGEKAAFIDMGDQFLALMQVEEVTRDATRHFGLVVDNRDGLRARMEADEVPFVSQKRFDFLDPWGNRVEVVDYRDIQFLKPRAVLAAQGFEGLSKHAGALGELRAKGIVPPEEA